MATDRRDDAGLLWADRGTPTRRSVVAAALLGSLGTSAFAQPSWPSRLITYVVPYPPGGTTDILGRMVAQELNAALGVPVVVENRPGATGTVGGAAVARAAPNGETLLGTSIGPQTIAPHLSKLSYDPAKSYEPVVMLGTVPHILAVAAKSPFNSVQDLLAAAKAKPGGISFSSGGVGTILHMQGEFLKLQAGADMLHVPYRGDAPAMQDVISGQVTFVFIPISASLPQVKEGTLKALAVTSAGRLPDLPQTPTMTELGFSDFVVEQWQAVYAPAGTPAAVVGRLNEIINAMLRKPAIVSRLTEIGITPAGGTPADLARQQAADFERWGRVIKAANVKAE